MGVRLDGWVARNLEPMMGLAVQLRALGAELRV